MQFQVFLSLWSVTSWLCIDKIPEVAKTKVSKPKRYSQTKRNVSYIQRSVLPVRNRLNRGLFANTYEHHHCVCHSTLSPSRAWTDAETKDIVNCLYFHFESWSSRLWKRALHFRRSLWTSCNRTRIRTKTIGPRLPERVLGSIENELWSGSVIGCSEKAIRSNGLTNQAISHCIMGNYASSVKNNGCARFRHSKSKRFHFIMLLYNALRSSF